MGYAILATVLVVLFPFVYSRPQRGLLVVAATVPFHGLLPILPPGSVPPSWKEAAMGMVAVAAVLSPNRVSGRSPTLPWLRFLWVLIVMGTVSGLAVHGIYGALPVKITFFYAALVPLIVLFHPFTSRDRDLLTSIMMSIAIIAAVYGLAQQVIGPDRLVEWGFEWNVTVRTAGPLLRSFSIFQLPFPFGLFEMMVLLVGGSVALADPHRLRNKLFLWSSPVMLAGMAVSVVRASYLGFVIGIVFLAVVAYPRIRRWLLVAAVATIAAFFVLPATVTTNILSSNSFNERSTGWQQIIRDLEVHPFGQGLGLTGAAADKLALREGVTRVPYQPDNYYVKLGLELGPIAVVLFLVILVAGYLVMTRTYRVSQVPEDRAFAIGVASFILAAAAASVVATFLEIFPIDFYFWLLLSVGASTVRFRRSSLPDLGGRRSRLPFDDGSVSYR